MGQRIGRSVRTLWRGFVERDRGATLPEYALGIASVCVASLGAISFLTDSSADEFESRGERVGSPDLEAGLPGGTTGGSDGGSTTTGGGDPDLPPASISAGPSEQAVNHPGNSNNWDATITLHMQGDGSPVEGLRITGTWTLYVEGVVQPSESPLSCTTGQNGDCVFTRDDMEWRTPPPASVHPVTKAVFTVTSYTYTLSEPAQSYTIPPAPAQTIEVDRP